MKLSTATLTTMVIFATAQPCLSQDNSFYNYQQEDSYGRLRAHQAEEAIRQRDAERRMRSEQFRMEQEMERLRSEYQHR